MKVSFTAHDFGLLVACVVAHLGARIRSFFMSLDTFSISVYALILIYQHFDRALDMSGCPSVLARFQYWPVLKTKDLSQLPDCSNSCCSSPTGVLSSLPQRRGPVLIAISEVERSRLFHNLIRTTQRPPGYVAHNISRDPGLVDCTVDLCGHIGLHSPSPSPQCG
eukprot:g71861.t1